MERQSDFAHFDVHAHEPRPEVERRWARMREQPALPRSDALGGFYIVSRFAELKQALLDPQLFSSAQGITIPNQSVRSRHIPAEVDPPSQKQYRALTARHFAADRVKALEPVIRNRIEQLIAGFAEGGKVEFVDRFARPLPVHVSLALLGLPAEDAPALDALVVALHEEVATGARSGAAARLTDYVRHTLITRGAAASLEDDTLLSVIRTGWVDGRPLTLDEQISMVRLILIGGFDTTAIALATAMWWLARYPQDAATLRERPALIDSFSEEVVRFASPSTYLRRTVTRDTAFGGRQLRAGDLIVLNFGAANRDPAQFDDPDMIRLDRTPGHLGFGFGAHRCIGSLVAKLQLRVAITELLARFGHIELRRDGEIGFGFGLNQGIIRLPLRLAP